MTTPEDAELAQALDSLMAAKRRQQRTSWAWLALALAAGILAFTVRPRLWALPGGLLVAGVALQAGVRAHLRADALRNQAMERILAEAFRREGNSPQA